MSDGSQQSVTPVSHNLMLASGGTCTHVFHMQTTDEHINKTNTLFVEPMDFIKVYYRNTEKELLTRAKGNQRQLILTA